MSGRGWFRWSVFKNRLSPLARLFLLAILVFAGGLAAVHEQTSRPITVITAADNLDPGHILTSADLRRRTVDDGNSEETFRHRRDVIGRVVIDSVASGDQIYEHDVGTMPLSAGQRVFGLDVTERVTLSENFAIGDRVDVLLGSSGMHAPRSISDVAIVGVPKGEHRVLALTVDEREQEQLIAAIGHVPIVVVRACC